MPAPTVEEIEKQFNESFVLRNLLEHMLKQIRNIEKEGGSEAREAATAVIKGEISLNDIGKKEALKKCGRRGMMSLTALQNLTDAQKQYILKKLGWE